MKAERKNDLNGLSNEEVLKRTAAGLVNSGGLIPTKSFKDIIRANTLTFFNLINICLAAAVIAVGSFESALFIGVVIWNILIGTVQEIRAKRITDKLSLISQPKAEAIREGKNVTIDFRDIVLGDLLRLKSGMQVSADCEIIFGECEVNESLLTGENEPRLKSVTQILLSGSFIVSGEVYARAVRVGADNFSGRITAGARFLKKNNSKMFRAVDKIVKGISVVILPIMALLFYQSLFMHGEPLEKAVVSVVAAVIGMIPEGLVLLISIVMAVGALRLSRYKALVQDIYCIETLARIDVLCLDKTGTITEGKMKAEEIVLLGSSYSEREISRILGTFINALPDENPTANAIRERFTDAEDWKAAGVRPFSSGRKWSGVRFKDKGTFIAGAAELILKEGIPDNIKAKINRYSMGGKRVVLFARSDLDFNGGDLPAAVIPLALIILSDAVRREAPNALRFFADNNVEIKIISGDSPLTVAHTAAEAGVKGAGNYVDMAQVDDSMIGEAAAKYTVFGRTSPSQKLALVKALKAGGRTVGMTGDGVNDVLALKNADCSIAMQSGSDAARNVSDIVLLDSNFASIPKIVKEGRRSINNVERSAVLFLTKTVFSLIIGIAYIFVAKPYPILPVQMTLINALFIGIPSFILALEPNSRLVRGSFIENVLKKALPYGLCHVVCISLLTVLGHLYRLTPDEIRGISIIILGIVSLLILCRLCMPFNKKRAFMVILLGAAFVFAVCFFENLFITTDYSRNMFYILSALLLLSVSVVWYLPAIGEAIIRLYKTHKGKNESGE